MSTSIIAIRRDADRGSFMDLLDQHGLDWRPVEGLSRHFIVEGASPDELPPAIKDASAVEAVDDGEGEIRGAAMQDITLDSLLEDGPWAIARTVRRDAPWNVDGIVHPFSTYFRSVRDGDGVDYYSIDSGIRTTHDEHSGRVTNVYEAVSSGGEGDDNGHGTGTSSASCGATVGFARAALIWSFKCLDSTATGNNTWIINALGQALSHYQGRSSTNRPAVVNISIVNAGSTINSAVGDLIDAGMVVVACAGNDMNDLGTIGMFPAESDPDVVIVGGTNMADLPYYWTSDGTNFGSEVDVLAPSVAIRWADIAADDSYVTKRGTSIGCGFVSGVVACMLEGHGRLTTRAEVQAVKAQLISNATTGRFRSGFGLSPLPDAILYLDPDQQPPEPISGL